MLSRFNGRNIIPDVLIVMKTSDASKEAMMKKKAEKQRQKRLIHLEHDNNGNRNKIVQDIVEILSESDEKHKMMVQLAKRMEETIRNFSLAEKVYNDQRHMIIKQEYELALNETLLKHSIIRLQNLSDRTTKSYSDIVELEEKKENLIAEVSKHLDMKMDDVPAIKEILKLSGKEESEMRRIIANKEYQRMNEAKSEQIKMSHNDTLKKSKMSPEEAYNLYKLKGRKGRVTHIMPDKITTQYKYEDGVVIEFNEITETYRLLDEDSKLMDEIKEEFERRRAIPEITIRDPREHTRHLEEQEKRVKSILNRGKDIYHVHRNDHDDDPLF
jgi:hypothetical protein